MRLSLCTEKCAVTCTSAVFSTQQVVPIVAVTVGDGLFDCLLWEEHVLTLAVGSDSS